MVARRRPLSGRELWRIGDWGGASGHIGRRWEQVGVGALGRLVGQPSPNQPAFLPAAVLSLVHQNELEQAVQGAGLTHADALLFGLLDDRPAIQPIDFKWSLEVARVGQVAAETLDALLAAELPPVAAAVERGLGELRCVNSRAEARLPRDEVVLLDGLFLSPDHAANRAFLASQANLRQERPLDPREVVLEPVEGLEFFSVLPGWEIAQLLAAQEGARRMLESLEGAEHYYRLGAGVLGALLASKRSIFDPVIPSIDPLAELGALRRRQRLATTEQLIAYLDRVMVNRSELRKTFNQLGRSIYSFASFRSLLRRYGVNLPERGENGPEQRAWSRLYGQAQAELSAHLSRDGLALVGRGQTDAQVLAGLTAQSPRYAELAQQIVERLVQAELAASVNGQ